MKKFSKQKFKYYSQFHWSITDKAMLSKTGPLSTCLISANCENKFYWLFRNLEIYFIMSSQLGTANTSTLLSLVLLHSFGATKTTLLIKKSTGMASGAPLAHSLKHAQSGSWTSRIQRCRCLVSTTSWIVFDISMQWSSGTRIPPPFVTGDVKDCFYASNQGHGSCIYASYFNPCCFTTTLTQKSLFHVISHQCREVPLNPEINVFLNLTLNVACLCVTHGFGQRMIARYIRGHSKLCFHSRTSSNSFADWETNLIPTVPPWVAHVSCEGVPTPPNAIFATPHCLQSIHGDTFPFLVKSVTINVD